MGKSFSIFWKKLKDDNNFRWVIFRHRQWKLAQFSTIFFIFNSDCLGNIFLPRLLVMGLLSPVAFEMKIFCFRPGREAQLATVLRKVVQYFSIRSSTFNYSRDAWHPELVKTNWNCENTSCHVVHVQEQRKNVGKLSIKSGFEKLFWKPVNLFQGLQILPLTQTWKFEARQNMIFHWFDQHLLP